MLLRAKTVQIRSRFSRNAGVSIRNITYFESLCRGTPTDTDSVDQKNHKRIVTNVFSHE